MTKLLVSIFLSLFSFNVLAEWVPVKRNFLPQERVLNGEVEAVNKATVSAQTSGRVSKLYFGVDDFVAKGEIIAEFTNTEQKALVKQTKATAKAAKIAYQQSVTDFERIIEIHQKKLVSKSELEKAESHKNALKAQFEAANAAVESAIKQLDYTRIIAPYDGIVTQRLVQEGESVQPGTPIMEGVSLTSLRVVTHLPENLAGQIKANPRAKIIFHNKEISASDITIFPYADRASRSFKTRIYFEPSSQTLFPGMTVKVIFKIGEDQALTIPKEAIVQRGELTLVYVKQEDKKLLRHVKLGKLHGDVYEVLSGLTENEQVLVNPLTQR